MHSHMQRLPGVLRQSRHQFDYVSSFLHFTVVNLLADLILLLNYYEFAVCFFSIPDRT